MIRHRALLASFLLLACADLTFGQFQRSLIQPRNRRLSAAPAEVPLLVSCLDYGVATPGERDVFEGISGGHGFLIRSAPNGPEQVDLNTCIRSGWVVLRGTGQDNVIMAEVRVPGWDELRILPGAQALPPRSRPAIVPETTVQLLAAAAAHEDDMETIPAGLRSIFERLAVGARQEHVWGVYSNSRQALDPGLTSLPAVLDALRGLREDPSALARLQWVLRRPPSPDELAGLGKFFNAPLDRESGLEFLRDFVVLRAAGDAKEAKAYFELCTRAGAEKVPLSAAGLRRILPKLKAATPGRILLTNELLAGLGRAGLVGTLDSALATAGHSVLWHLQDDYLLLQRFDPGPAVARKFAVIAPDDPVEAKAIFGGSAPAAFAFKPLIQAGKVEQVKTLADVERIAGGLEPGAGLVLICVQRYGRIRLPDGSELAMEMLPARVTEILACDALDKTEKLSLGSAGNGVFGFDDMSAAVTAATAALRDARAPTRLELTQALASGCVTHWKAQGGLAAGVVYLGRSVSGDGCALGNRGTLFKVLTPRQRDAARAVSMVPHR